MTAGGSDRKALSFIFVTVLLDVAGFGIVIPVTPELIMELTGTDMSGAARYGGWLLFVYALMQFVFAPIMGNLSDAYGRRPVLLIAMATFSLDYILMGLAPTIFWLFVGRIFAGISGATHSPANAFIADVSAPEDRAKNFGLLGAAFGLGFIVGPVLGGFLGEFGPRVPFFAAAGLAFANATWGFFFLPESLPREGRRPFRMRRANPLGALGQMRRYPVVIGLFAAMVLFQLAHDANPAVWTYYTMFKFDWTERDVGLSLGAVGFMIAIVQGMLIRSILPWLGERRTVYAGLTLIAIGFLGFAVATETWMMYAFMVPFALGGVATPALRGIMANQVPPDSQGELQGAITSLISLTAIAAPLIMTNLFFVFSAEDAGFKFPGAPFLAAGVLALSSAVVVRSVMTRARARGDV
jgi:DHA1 family tetracycline resistance protein-like MFS transporter